MTFHLPGRLRQTPPLYSIQYHHHRLTTPGRQGFSHAGEIMTVTFAELKSETRQTIAQRKHGAYISGRPKALQAIVVHQDNEILQTVVGGENRGFESRSFLPFAVGG